MKCKNLKSILTTLVFLLASLLFTEAGHTSRLFDLISGITRTSRNVIENAVERVKDVMPNRELQFPDDTVFYQLIIYLKDKMRDPHPELDLPILDPYVADHMHFNITNKIIGELILNLENINITKASQFEVNRVQMYWFAQEFYFNVTFPEVHFTGNYNLTGILGDVIPVEGDGPAEISISNINCQGILEIGFRNHFLYLNGIRLSYSVGAFHINLTNFMGGGRLGELLNKVLSEAGNDILALVKNEVTDVIESGLYTAANHVLNKMHLTLEDVMNFLDTLGKKTVRALMSLIPFKAEF